MLHSVVFRLGTGFIGPRIFLEHDATTAVLISFSGCIPREINFFSKKMFHFSLNKMETNFLPESITRISNPENPVCVMVECNFGRDTHTRL